MAVIQMKAYPNKANNIKKAGDMIREASKNGANVVVLPEMFCTPYT